MKLAVWGAVEVGKSSITTFFRDYFSIPATNKIHYKSNNQIVNFDSFVIKGLIDNRIEEKKLSDFVTTLSKDVKHLLIYRKNLLSHFLAWHHIESIHNDNSLDVNKLDIKMCKQFIDEMKKLTKETYNVLNKNAKFVHTISYEELYFDDCRDRINNFLESNISVNEWKKVSLIKYKQNDSFTNDLHFVFDNNIEKYNYKENFDILKDMFIDEQLIL